MGLLVEGQWVDSWYDTKKSKGHFERDISRFRNWITADGELGPTGEHAFKAEKDRYHLYVSLACPWAHRTLIFRKLKQLESVISVSVVEPHMLSNGWEFHRPNSDFAGLHIDASDQDMVSVGDSVEVELPSEERIKATISYIDPVVTQGQNGDFIEVKLDISSSEGIKVYDQAPVDVFVTSEVSQDVLYVPVNALIALAEGGYALEVFNGESEVGVFEGVSGVDTTYVGVEIGVFTDGFVEVSGNISEGMIVVVPR